MAEEERKIIGYSPLGNPVYEVSSSYKPTKEEEIEQLLRNLDCVCMFENGKGYYRFSKDEYFEMDEKRA